MNEIEGRLKAPAIGLITAAAFNAISGVLIIFASIMRLIRPQRIVFASEEERLGYVVSGVVLPVVGFISLALAPLIVYGAIQMLKARRYGMARLAAILSLIPFCSCCFVLGVPIGFWALAVLHKPEVKAVFERPESPVK